MIVTCANIDGINGGKTVIERKFFSDKECKKERAAPVHMSIREPTQEQIGELTYDPYDSNLFVSAAQKIDDEAKAIVAADKAKADLLKSNPEATEAELKAAGQKAYDASTPFYGKQMYSKEKKSGYGWHQEKGSFHCSPSRSIIKKVEGKNIKETAAPFERAGGYPFLLLQDEISHSYTGCPSAKDKRKEDQAAVAAAKAAKDAGRDVCELPALGYKINDGGCGAPGTTLASSRCSVRASEGYITAGSADHRCKFSPTLQTKVFKAASIAVTGCAKNWYQSSARTDATDGECTKCPKPLCGTSDSRDPLCDIGADNGIYQRYIVQDDPPTNCGSPDCRSDDCSTNKHNLDISKYRTDSCIAWRQTGGCKPDGPREPGSDKTCTDSIPYGASGYCECENGRKAKEISCENWNDNKFITMMTRTVTFIENGQRRRKKEQISCDDACGGPYFGKRCYEDCGIFDPKTEKHKKNLQWTFDSRCTIKVDCPICAEVSDAALFIDGTTTCTPTEVDDQSNFQYNSATLNTVHRLGAALVGVAVACLL